MVRHQKCHGVADVDKFINSAGLRLDQVQVVYGMSRVGGDYYVFYETPAPPAKKRTSPGMSEEDARAIVEASRGCGTTATQEQVDEAHRILGETGAKPDA